MQPHVLFTQGYRILEQLFPGIGSSLAASGAVPFDWGRDFRYFQKGNWSPTSVEPAGLESFTCSRPLLESTVRQRVSQIPNVQFLEAQRVIGLIGDRSRNTVTGIRIGSGDRRCGLRPLSGLWAGHDGECDVVAGAATLAIPTPPISPDLAGNAFPETACPQQYLSLVDRDGI